MERKLPVLAALPSRVLELRRPILKPRVQAEIEMDSTRHVRPRP